ncbi:MULTISPECIES: IclR family transcriptional regulator [unclassified Undibacterium]|uniref:IclR family transcriptional regulator n=2 Tax=Pseudomonadati TaxID=3379134 RepID=UPI002AC97934|nr:MULTISPECIES: IclR family transcriptional regulator [unclassified Undibacterium]MEB0137431.1 IclR family transcriptional regulator [Undibacterium sp. CCC2.1]MEB0170904.1 IclR family transcriptional regulator [Undibacterium sp. CCC1.1]MEB0174856.1 IclR family transcriptional regulator [Undibacterium sp. CCC3.4]MEB0214192.1 IclR family transcriptional regulator [Undibacterium sp. 5I2]WPX44503.1 IclR family transcriptional regulator [Undibacterium sp. CCC3.4]
MTTAPVPQNERQLQLLSCIARHGQALSARDLAAQTGQPLSTVYRQLLALKKWGLVQEHQHSGHYEAGPLALQLAWSYDQHSWLIAAARSEIDRLVERSGESVGLLCHLNGQVMCIALQDSPQALRCSFAKGRAHVTVRGASAKALLAYLPADSQQELITADFLSQVPQSAAALDALQAQLQQIRLQRYATSESEVDAGIWGVSVPVFSAHQQLQATLSLMAPLQRSLGRQPELITLTLAAADRLSSRLQQT